MEQLLNSKAKRWGEHSQTLAHKVRNNTSQVYDPYIYAATEGMTKLRETCSSPSSLSSHISLSSCLARTLRLPAPSALQPCTPAHADSWECRVSAMTPHPTNRLRWERLGSVVGTLLPSLVCLPGNRCRLREGPPAACCLNERQTKTLATRWVTRVNVGFSVAYYFSLPHLCFFSFMAGAPLYILEGLKK